MPAAPVIPVVLSPVVLSPVVLLQVAAARVLSLFTVATVATVVTSSHLAADQRVSPPGPALI